MHLPTSRTAPTTVAQLGLVDAVPPHALVVVEVRPVDRHALDGCTNRASCSERTNVAGRSAGVEDDEDEDADRHPPDDDGTIAGVERLRQMDAPNVRARTVTVANDNHSQCLSSLVAPSSTLGAVAVGP